jgi:monoterpene epsilon-lactone hydrolase
MTIGQSASATAIRHPLHLRDRAAMVAMRAMIALSAAPDFGPGGRAAFDKLMEGTPAGAGVTYEPATLGGVAGWWCHPGVVSGTAILYLHGGAYVLGSAQANRHFVGQIALRAGVSAFVPDYRLAPEHPFPAALDDATSAYRGLAEAGFSRIAIAGDSAGGGLALVTAARLVQDADNCTLPAPAALGALSPWTDLALTGDSIGSRAAHDPLLTAARLDAARKLYLGAFDARHPMVSPQYGDVAGLPPVMLHVGEDEILLDDARRFADRLAMTGSHHELHIWEGMVHVFPASLKLLRAGQEAVALIGAFLRYHLGNSTGVPAPFTSS